MLSQYKVLDVTGRRGAMAGYLLAMHGAQVTRVVTDADPDDDARYLTSTGGVGRAAVDASFGRGKQTLVLDGDRARQRERLRELIAEADVLLESWTPGERADWGLDPATTAALTPRLVHASLTPFGIDGPKAAWAATDLTIMASASPLAVTGDRDRAPVRMSIPQAHSFAGAAAAGAVLLALFERERSGLGQHVDVPAQTAAALATQTGLLATGVGAPALIRSAGGASMGNMSLRFLYPAADGHVSITHVFGEIGGPATGRLMQWVHEAGFCDAAMRDKDWIRYPTLVELGEEPVESWEQVKDTVAAFTSSLTKAELLAGAVERNLLMAPVSELGEVIDLPHLTARSFFATEELPDGRQVRVPGPYARYTAPATAPLPAEQQIPPVRKPVGDDLPLAGVRVLDLTWSVAGPAMTRVLADHGATVVKIESTRKLDAARTFIPFHDNVASVENSAGFDNMNAGKLSIALDTSTRQGKEVLDDLLRWCDVMVDSLSPRGRRAMGLDDERVRSLNPRIVNMSTSLFGLDGPLADLAGYGNLGAAIAGCYDITGWPDRAPAGPYLAYTDYTSSHLMLVSVMASLLHRHDTGGGQFVELSQTETALQFLAPGLVAAQASGGRVTRIGNDDAEMAPHGVYPCLGDDAWVAVACDGDDQWRALCGLMGRTDLADDPSLTTADGRVARRRELDEAVSAWTATLAPDAATLACQGAGVAAHTVQNSPECLADPQLAHRGHFVELDHPSRLCLVENTRFRLGRTPGAPRRRAPSLGEHAFEILTDLLGYDSERVAELAAAEILE